MPILTAFFLPHFGHGGAEGVVLTLLRHLDRSRFRPMLILQRGEGELLKLVPEDVPVMPLQRARPPRGAFELARIYRREGVALAVTVTNAASLYSLIAARIAGNIPTLVTEHTPLSAFLAEAKRPALRRFAIRRIYPRARLTGGPVPEIGEDLRQLLGPDAPPFMDLPNPVISQVAPLRRLSDNPFRVVSVGRLAAEKRFDLLIDAFALLHARMPDARLVIHGEGAERSGLEARIARLGLAGIATLPGYSNDIAAVHRDADLFVCTSRREGLGNAMIEAMACGVPVVSVDCPFGPKRLLRGGKAGLLVRDHRPEPLASAMQTVLRDKDLRATFISNGLQIAEDYRIGPAVRRYETAMLRAVSGAGASGQ